MLLPGRRYSGLFSLFLALLIAVPTVVTAQRIVGTVHTTAGEPLGNVVVSTSATLTTARTDRMGVFRLPLPPGSHVLMFRRIGYGAAQVSVQIGSTDGGDTLRIVLSPASRELKGLVIRGERDEAMALTLSSQTLRNAPALGESDVFRSLPLLPAISQPNDVIDVIHLAGGASDEAAITLGGHPLQAPFHIGNVMGALNVAALSQASVLMHHIPARSDGYLSGEIALVPRAVTNRGSRELVVSLLSASATVTQPIGTRSGILVSARRTYIDQVLKAVSRRNASEDFGIPGFRDLLVQVTGGHGEAWTWDLLGYGLRNAAQTSSERPGEVPLEMVEGMVGVHGGYRRANWNTGVRLSIDQNRARNSELFLDSSNALAIRDNLIDQRWLTGELDVSITRNRWQFRSGVLGRMRTHRFLWSREFVDLAINTPVAAPMDTVMSQTRLGASAEGSLALFPRTSISVGSHLSTVNGRAYPSPRLTFEWRPTDSVTINAALNRRLQFDAVAGVPREVSTAQPIFFLQRPRRADVATLSMTWNAPGLYRFDKVRLSSSIYQKHYHDRTVLESPGVASPDAQLPSDSRPSMEFDRGPGDVRGISLSVEMSTASRLSLYSTYTGERVREVYQGQMRPSAWDIPHQVSLYAALSLSKRLSFNTVFQAHSGPATTPVLYRVLVPMDFGYGQRYVYGKPNTARFPGYRRADASLTYGWQFRQSDWQLSAQVINLFMRTNGIQYHLPSYLECAGNGRACVDGGATRRSLPILPSIGLDVRW